MTRKMLWIAMWTTLTLWLGNFWGCAASPNHDAAMHEQENAPAEMASDHDVYQEYDSEGADVAAAVETNGERTTVAMTPLVPAQVAPAQVAPEMQQAEGAVLPAPAPEIISVGAADGSSGTLNRSGWAKVRIAPADGSVRHYPLYFKDYEFPDRERSFEGDPLANAVDALDGQQRSTFSPDNLAGIFVQPVVFGLDTILAAPRMVMTPPWTYVYSE